MAPDSPCSKPVSLFHYHAYANAFSGRFTRPFEAQIDVQAASSLPATGGHGSTRVENFQFREFISFKKGYTHVSGAQQSEDSSNNTLVTAALEGLNMLDILTADRIVARLYSKHPKGSAEGNITMHGSKFENLSICGRPVNITLDLDLFEGIQTYEQAQKAFLDPASDFRKIAREPFQDGRVLEPQGDNGVFLCSLVKEMDVDYPGVEHCGHSLHVPGFGTVYFAEVLITHGQRTLTMLRFELGSTTSAKGSAISATTNGKNYPPGG
jgi:hypothetical protein